MTLRLGEVFPDFAADTSAERIESFHEWMSNSWTILFSHPKDFTPVCTSELARVASLMPAFRERNVKVCALSSDSADSHRQWLADIAAYANAEFSKTTSCKLCKEAFPFPIIADEKRELIERLGMTDPNELNADGLPMSARAVFIIGPDKRLKLSLLYPASTGRNFDEILRVLDSLQLTAKRSLATPVDWKVGEKCIVDPKIDDQTANREFGEFETVDLPSQRRYLRRTHVN